MDREGEKRERERKMRERGRRERGRREREGGGGKEKSILNNK